MFKELFKNLYLNVKAYFLKNRFKLLFKVLTSNDWTYTSLLEIEYLKISQMLEYYQKMDSVLLTDNEETVRYLKLSKSLLEIMLKDDNENCKLNWNNIDRVCQNKQQCEFFKEAKCNDSISKYAQEDLYNRKVSMLYHNIRRFKEHSWWT